MGKDADDLGENLVAAEREVDELRERTQSLVEELERRVHARVDSARGAVERVKQIANLPAQLRAHPRASAGIGAGTVVVAGLGIWYLVAQRRREQRPLARVRRRAAAYRQILADPEGVLRKQEPIGRRLIGAIIVTFATVLVRAAARRLAARAIDRPLELPDAAITAYTV